MGLMAQAGKRKATAVDTLPPICAGAFVTSIIMYPADVVRAICMSNPGTGPGAALKGFLEAHGVMGFVKQGLVAEVTRASISREHQVGCAARQGGKIQGIGGLYAG